MSELVHLAEFQARLQNPDQPYQPSEEDMQVVQAANVALMVGPTNSGRNTIIDELMLTGDYYYLVSDTTREPRVRNGKLEQNGVEYWFRSEEDFLEDLNSGSYVEAAIIHRRQVSGTSVREIAAAYEQDKVAITDIEIAGVDSIRNIKDDTVCVFILPPSFDVWHKRIAKSGDLSHEHTKKDLLTRMESAVKEYQDALNNPFYWFVINDVLEEAVEYADKLIKTHEVDVQKQEAGRQLAQLLMKQTEEYLQN